MPGTSTLFLLDFTSPTITIACPPANAVHVAELRFSPEQSAGLHAGFDDL